MRYDLWRFLGVLLLSSLLGILFGHIFLFITIGLIVFIFWQFNEYKKILSWLQKRKDFNSPSQSGLVDEICREVFYLRKRNKSRKKKLSGYLRQFQDATSALPDAVIVLGSYGEIEWANNKSSDYIGVQWPQDAGLRLSNLIRYPELLPFLESNESVTSKGIQIKSPIDNQLILELRISNYGDDGLKLLVARDITSISRINKMRKDFIANASHELRTPLTVISGYLENFVDDIECPNAWKSYLQQMRSQTIRMRRLIEDLMQLSSLEAGSRQVEKEIIVVPDMLKMIINEAKSLSGFMGHKINLESAQGLYLDGNRQELYSIFSNIVFNAVQYTPEFGQIDVSWFENDHGAIFQVKDNGLGIAAEHIPRLTERFYRIDKGRSREKGGTGLGLAIVKHALARHNAQLSIYSELGVGSEFTCIFPKSLISHAEVNKKKALTG